MTFYNVIGLLAGIFTGISMLPQLVKVIRKKQADEVSAVTLIILISGLALWVYYGILKEEYPIIITNAFSCLVNTVLLYCKFRYSH